MKPCFKFIALIFAVMALHPATAQACAVCYGEPDSPVTKALTWAILAMVVIVMTVLAGAVAFFVHANKKAGLVQAAESATCLIEKN